MKLPKTIRLTAISNQWILLERLSIKLNEFLSSRASSQTDVRVIYCHENIGHIINASGRYEKEALDLTISLLRKICPGVFEGEAIDIGANIGNHSLYFNRFFKKIYSFEPVKETYEILKINTKRLNTIQIFNKAASSQKSEETILINTTNMGASRISNSQSDGNETIFCDKIDDMIPKSADIRLIKIDVEGHEEKALIGASLLITSKKPVILLEQNCDAIRNGSSNCIDLLRENGYIFYVREDKSFTEKFRLLRVVALMRKAFLAKPIVFTELDYFNSVNYDMIIAIHPDVTWSTR